jgi:hypothetical protein
MQAMTDTGTELRRKRARRTALIAGAFAVAVFVISIVQMLNV